MNKIRSLFGGVRATMALNSFNRSITAPKIVMRPLVPRAQPFSGFAWSGLVGEGGSRIPCFARSSGVMIGRKVNFSPNVVQLTVTRNLNRNARLPKKSNHGKRPCSRMRRRLKAKQIKSRAHRQKAYGSY